MKPIEVANLGVNSFGFYVACTVCSTITTSSAGSDTNLLKKALSILNDKGYIFLTVPFGKHRWQPDGFHQNYNWQGILDLTKGSKIIESHTYTLKDDYEWIKTDPHSMEEVLYTDKAHGVGLFVLQKI